MRSRAQLAAIFASLKGRGLLNKGPLARARALRKSGMLKLRNLRLGTVSGKGGKVLQSGGLQRHEVARSLGLRSFFTPEGSTKRWGSGGFYGSKKTARTSLGKSARRGQW